MPTVKRVQTLPAFDGIRGIAVLAVVFAHLPQVVGSTVYNIVWDLAQQIRSAYICLDVFFVVSGFFITRLLLAEREATGTISLSTFYMRRSIRIFPIYYLTIVVCYIIFHFGVSDTISLLTYTFNFYHPLNPAPLPLEQAWSLSVEEQFYIVWPFLILFVPSRLASLVTGRIVPLVAIVCALAISLWLRTGDQLLSGNLVYMSSFTRMLSLSLGGWLAVRELEARPLRGWRCLALAALAIALLALDRVGRNDGIIASQGLYWTIALVSYAALSVAFIGTIIFDAGRFARWLRVGLSVSPLRGVGRISYGLYLYHLPVLFYFGLNDAVMAGGKAPLGTVALASLIILALSVVSYFVIERPLLALRSGGQRTATPESSPVHQSEPPRPGFHPAE